MNQDSNQGRDGKIGKYVKRMLEILLVSFAIDKSQNEPCQRTAKHKDLKGHIMNYQIIEGQFILSICGRLDALKTRPCSGLSHKFENLESPKRLDAMLNRTFGR